MPLTQQSFLGLGPDGFHRIAYTDWGDARNAHVVLCVHGLSRNSRDFDRLAPAPKSKIGDTFSRRVAGSDMSREKWAGSLEGRVDIGLRADYAFGTGAVCSLILPGAHL